MQPSTCVNNTIVDAFEDCPSSNDTFCTREVDVTTRELITEVLTIQATKFCYLDIKMSAGTPPSNLFIHIGTEL